MLLHHIGIIVPELDQGVRALNATLPELNWSARLVDPMQQVEVRFGGMENGPLYEVIAPTSETSPIQRALKSRRDVINHLAYLCDDILVESDRLRNDGCMAIGEPKPGIVYDSAPIQFFLAPSGFLFELIEHNGPVIRLDHKFYKGVMTSKGCQE